MQILNGEIIYNDVNKNAKGGSELMTERLVASVDKDLLSKFQITVSRLQHELAEDKRRIYICHDLHHDPAVQHLANRGWERFNKIVFVSHWQQQHYIEQFDIPWSKTVVMQNAIYPLERKVRGDVVNIVYHTTPHRGLDILTAVFDKLYDKFGDKIHLNVYSSFKVYGWEERDKDFESLYDTIKNHEGMTYHGSIPNDGIRDVLGYMDIFAYPCVWPETSCLSLMEAMSAGLLCVHPNLAALPETAANWTLMYNWHEDKNDHANIFMHVLGSAIQSLFDKNEDMLVRSQGQQSYANLFYNWNLRKLQWENLLTSVAEEPILSTVVEEVFSYRT